MEERIYCAPNGYKCVWSTLWKTGGRCPVTGEIVDPEIAKVFELRAAEKAARTG